MHFPHEIAFWLAVRNPSPQETTIKCHFVRQVGIEHRVVDLANDWSHLWETHGDCKFKPMKKPTPLSGLYAGKSCSRKAVRIFAHRLGLHLFFYAKIAWSVRWHTLAEYSCCTFTTNLPQIQLASIRFLCRSNCA